MVSNAELKDKYDILIIFNIFIMLMILFVALYTLLFFEYPRIDVSAKIPHEHIYNQSTNISYECVGDLERLRCGIK